MRPECQVHGCYQLAHVWVKKHDLFAGDRLMYVCGRCSQEMVALFGWVRR